jgi:acyl carrier protein
MVDVFEEWVRRDIGTVYVQMFDTALANWFGEPAGMCVHAETCGLQLAIEHTGDLYSCDHFVEPDFLLGNIKDKHMLELIVSCEQEFGIELDPKALPAPTISDFETLVEYIPPRDGTERKLVQLWEEVLGVRPISVTASFFDLGGRSVLAARLFTRMSRTFGKELPLSTLFRSPTVEQLANE